MDRFLFLVVGIFFIVVGANIFFIQGYKIPWWGRYAYGPYPPVLGALFVIAGLIFVYTGIRNIIRKRKEKP